MCLVVFSDEEPISLFQDLARDHSACREATVFKVASKKRCKTVCTVPRCSPQQLAGHTERAAKTSYKLPKPRYAHSHANFTTKSSATAVKAGEHSRRRPAITLINT